MWRREPRLPGPALGGAGGELPFINASAAALGGLDILVNNVGGAKGHGLLGSTDAQ